MTRMSYRIPEELRRRIDAAREAYWKRTGYKAPTYSELARAGLTRWLKEVEK